MLGHDVIRYCSRRCPADTSSVAGVDAPGVGCRRARRRPPGPALARPAPHRSGDGRGGRGDTGRTDGPGGHSTPSARRCAISTRRSRATARSLGCCRSWPTTPPDYHIVVIGKPCPARVIDKVVCLHSGAPGCRSVGHDQRHRSPTHRTCPSHDVAEYLGVTTKTVFTMIADGRLPAYKLGAPRSSLRRSRYRGGPDQLQRRQLGPLSGDLKRRRPDPPRPGRTTTMLPTDQDQKAG